MQLSSIGRKMATERQPKGIRRFIDGPLLSARGQGSASVAATAARSDGWRRLQLSDCAVEERHRPAGWCWRDHEGRATRRTPASSGGCGSGLRHRDGKAAVTTKAARAQRVRQSAPRGWFIAICP